MIAQAVGALFNACWQGLAIVAVTSLALHLLTRTSAATRYAVWFAALIAVAALPAIDFGLAGAPQPVAAAAPAARFSVVQTGTVTYPRANAHASASRAAAVAVPTTTIGYAVEAAPDRVAQILASASGIAGEVGAALSRVAMPILLAWLFFSAVMLYRLALAYVRLRRVKRGLVPLNDSSVNRLIAGSARPVVVGVVDDIAMPCVLGFAKPAIALPAKLAVELSHDDLERIVRHEHAHVRRWDDVANVIQLIVQAVMCLNPAVHLIGRSLNVEREIACDDFAVEPLAERVQYAKCLTHIAVNGFSRSSALPAPGFFFNRKQLLVRVERLLERGHNGSTTTGTTARYALVGLAVVAIAMARVQLPVIAATATATASYSSPLQKTNHPAPASYVVPIVHVAPNIRVTPTIHVTPHIYVAPHIHVTPHIHVALTTSVGPTVAAASYSSPSVGQAETRLHLHLHNSARLASGGDFLDALASAGYKNLSVDELVRLKNVGVDGGLIDAAVRYSGSRPSVEMLVRMASVGVDAEYLRNLQSSGYPRMGLEDVIRMRAVGVDPTYIRDMSAALDTRPSIEQLTQLRALGVDPDYVRSFAQLGYDKLSPNDLMRLRAVGVDADYVRLLRSKGIGGGGLSIDDLIRMKSVGVE